MNHTKTYMLLILGILTITCGKDNKEFSMFCDTNNLTYTDDIVTIFQGSCGTGELNCHGDGAMYTFEMYDYNTTKLAVDSGRIIGSIKHEEDFRPMPKGGFKLQPCTIERIEQWIIDGAPE